MIAGVVIHVSHVRGLLGYRAGALLYACVPARARGSHAAALRVPDNRPLRPNVLSRAKNRRFQAVVSVFPE